MVGVSDMVNRMQGNFGADRDSYMTSLMRPELLILDDLGTERSTSAKSAFLMSSTAGG